VGPVGVHQGRIRGKVRRRRTRHGKSRLVKARAGEETRVVLASKAKYIAEQ
jgi:hypothetical protein